MAATALSLRAIERHAARLVMPALTFEELVSACQDEVYGTALRMLGDRDAAAEATSNVFLKVHRNLGRYDPARPLRHWLLAIAVNETISIARARQRERARRAPQAEAEGLPDARTSPEERALEREERDRIRAAVAALPALYRVPIVLRYFNDLSLEEIAKVTGRRVTTVGVQLLRGRALLRAALGEAR